MSTLKWAAGLGAMAVAICFARRAMRKRTAAAEAQLVESGTATRISYTNPTVPTARDEDRYVADIEAAANALYSAIHPRLRVGATTYLAEIASRDAFWTPDNIRRRDYAQEYAIWLAEASHHKYVWEHGDSRSIGRPLHVVELESGKLDDAPYEWFHNESTALEQAYRDWAKVLVAEGVIAPGELPAMTIHRPQLVV